MSVSLEETIAKLGEARKRGILGFCGIKLSHISKLLRELQERRKADSCEGCKNIGLWENEYENGLSCHCLRCTRRAEDNYEPERRTDGC